MCEKQYKILTWNINGAASLGWSSGDKRLQSEMVDKVLEQDAHIIVLTEFVITRGIDYLYECLENKKYIWFQVSRTGKNGILVAVKKELVDETCQKKQIYMKSDSISEFDGCNLLRVRIPLKCKAVLSVVGCRMEKVGKLEKQYEFSRKCFNELLVPMLKEISSSDICVLCGDFNNAMHYGELDKSFDEVKECYWKQKWSIKKKKYEGPFRPVAQYDYNLHIIKDCLNEMGFMLCEGEDDWTYGEKIHNDHIFVKGLCYGDSGIINTSLSDHNLLWAKVTIKKSNT